VHSVDELKARLAASTAPRPRKSTKKPWVPPTADDFARESVLCFDPSLTNTGWAVLVPDVLGDLVAFRTGVCSPPPTELGSDAMTLWRAHVIGELVTKVVWEHGAGRVDAVVHEMPTTTGRRVESSLMGSREVQRVARALCPATTLGTVYVRHAHATLLPPEQRGKAHTKAHTKAAVLRYVDVTSMLPRGSRLNEHVYDAMAVGLTYLHDRKRAAT
jgi:hypothetical protein